MFSLKRDALLLSLRPASEFRPIPAASDRRVWDNIGADLKDRLALRAQQALRTPLQPLTASMYLQTKPYVEAFALRREQLESLILGACAVGPARYLDALGDALWAVLEQTTWALPDAANPGLPPPEGQKIDLGAAETASMLALAHNLLKEDLDRISPALCARIRSELRRRVFAPLAGESQPGALRLSKDELPRAVDALMSAVLLLEDDDRGRWLCMRRLLTLGERCAGQILEGGSLAGLERRMRDVYALNNCLFMIALGSGGEVELRDEPEFARAALLPAALHIGGGWFVNPGGDTPRPNLNPASLFRTGDGVRSGELCALAAYLARPGVSGPRDAGGPLMHRLLDALYHQDFLKEPARVALRPSSCLEDMQILSARVDRFFVALVGGENRAGEGHLDVGDICLFYDGKPVVIDPGLSSGADMHSVPRVDLTEQGYVNKPPQEGVDFRFDPSYTLLSLGIAHAYPRAAQLMSWQRSLMLTSFEGSVRLMDVVDFEHGVKKPLCFRFLTPRAPVLEGDGILLGEILLRWEGELVPSIETVPLPLAEQRMLWGGAFYRVSLSTPEPVSGSTFAFVFRPA